MAGKYVKVVRRSSGEVLIPKVRWCSSHLCRLRGLQFSRKLPPDRGLVLVKNTDSIASSTIHMFFVTYPIAAIWINGAGRVTSAQLARPWQPYYASPEPARYVLEADPALLAKVSCGDELDFLPL